MIEVLWQDLKGAVQKQMSANVNELKPCCKEKWDKTQKRTEKVTGNDYLKQS